MTWNPWDKPVNKVENPEVDDKKTPPEKSPAELIAESLSTALKPVMDKLGEQDERFKVLESQTKRPEPKANPEDNRPVSVLDDEDVAFAQRMSPVYARTLELEAKMVRQNIFSEYKESGYGDLISQYGEEIHGLLDSSPLVTSDGRANRGDPQYIRNVIDMVFGRAARKGGMRFDGKNKGFFLETGGSGSEAGKAPEVDGMTDSQRKVATRMGIPLDKAKEALKKLAFVS